MFWLYEIDNNYNFYQIFTNYSSERIDDHNVYKFNNINTFNYSKYEYKKIIYDINILDNLIRYIDDNQNIKIFLTNINFLRLKNNDKQIFECNYKLVNNKRMPNLISNLYDNQYKIEFNIYKINNEILYVKEINLITKSERYYWLSKDIDSIDKLK